MAVTQQVSVPEKGLMLFTEGDSSVMTVKGYNPSISSNKTGTKPTEKKSNADDNQKQYKWAPWGDNDNYPRELLKKNEMTGVILRGIEINSDVHFGNGLMFYKTSYEDGKKKMEGFEPEWFSTLSRNIYLEEVQSELIESCNTMALAFIEVCTDPYGKEVTSAQVLDFCSTRFGWRNEKGQIKHVHYHPDIGTADLDEKKVVKIPLYDPTWTSKDMPTKFVIVVQARTFGRNYYPEPNYTASYKNGWAEVAWEVPKLIKSIYKNQMSVKYHVKVDVGTFKSKYKCWENPPDCSNEEEIQNWQLERIQEFRDEVNEHLTKTENAGKAIMTLRDEMGKIGVEIEPIKSFLDSAKELPNAQAANSEMLFVNGVDPSLVGSSVPGGNNLSGSGSDKREASKLKQALMKRSRVLSLKWLYIIGTKIYGMKPDEFITYIDIDISQTLDKNPTGKQQTSA